MTPFELKINRWDGESYIPETYRFFNEVLAWKTYNFLVTTEDMPSITLGKDGNELASKKAGFITVAWTENGETTRIKVDNMDKAIEFGLANYVAGAEGVAVYMNGERVVTWRW